MSFANINIGTTPGDHSGDPLRVAFNKINNNFQQIANGDVVLNLNAPVQSVAGRTGNVVITANDVLGSVTMGDVNAALTEFGQDYALNTYVDSEINNLIDSAPGNLNTLGKIASSLGNNPNLITNLTSDIVSINAKIAGLWSNALVQSEDLDSLHGDILAANLAIAQNAANIQVLFANAASQSAYLESLTSNAASQTSELAILTANAVSQQDSLAALNSNAASQDASLSNLLANAAAQQDSLSALLGNASSQQSTLTTLIANVEVIESKIAGANAAIITANTAMKSYVDAQATLVTNAWTANAAQQSSQITTLQGQVYTNSNIAAYLPTFNGNITVGNIVSASSFGENKLLGNLVIGGNVNRSATSWLTVNASNQNPIPSITTAQIIGDPNRAAQLTIDNINNDKSGSLHFRRARGTIESPQAVQANDVLGSMNARGFGNTTFLPSATAPGFALHASDSFTDTSQPTYATINIVRVGSNTSVVHSRFDSNGNLVIANGSPSTNFTSGALVVFGGAGIAGNVHSSGTINALASITTTANVNAGGAITSNGNITTLGSVSSVGSISAGGTVTGSSYFFANGSPLSLPFDKSAADLNLQLYGKNAYIANIQMSNSTLTGDGSALPLYIDFPETTIGHDLRVKDVLIANASIASTSAYNGALLVPYGGAGIQGNLFCAIQPNSRFQVGQGGAYFGNVIAQFTSDQDGPGQINMQNIRTSANAASEIVASADDGTQHTHYAKLGICNSIYSNPNKTAYKPLDGYLNVDGGNLLLSTERLGTSIKFINGGYSTSNVIGTWDANALAISTTVTLTSAIQFANLTTTQVDAISSPQCGMTVFNYTTGNIQVYNGTKWANVTLS